MEVLEKESQFCEYLVNNSLDGIFAFDNEFRYIAWNPEMERILGVSKAEVLGKCAFEIFPYLKETGEDESYYAALKGRSVAVKDRPYEVTETGREGLFEGHYAPLYGKKKEIIGGIGIIRDITEQKLAEHEVLRQKKYLDNIVESLTHPFYVIDVKDYSIKMANSASRLGDLSEDSTCYRLTHKRDKPCDDKEHRCPLKEVKKTKKPATVEHIHYDKDENPRVMEVHAFPIFDDEGEVSQIIEYSLDITERKMMEGELKNTLRKLRKAMERTIQIVATTVETKDPYTAGHQRRVAQLAVAIAKEMGLPKEQINGIYMASIIHDLGKISIPAEILSKPGELADEEFALIKTHPKIGYDILKEIEFPWPIAEIVFQHHERVDGSGYPSGLSGEDILIEAKIITVADVVEAMSSHRPYRPALGMEKALEEILKKRDIFYDATVVDALVKLLKEKDFQFKKDETE